MSNPMDSVRFVETGSARIAIQEFGTSGPIVILVHGIGSSGKVFSPVIAALSEIARPVVLDMRGHGQSSKPDSGYHYDDYVRDLETVVAEFSAAGPIVIGHSLGGIVAMRWAAQTSLKYRGLIIEDAPLRSGEGFRDAFEGWLTLNALSVDAAMAWYASRNPTWSEEVLRQRAFDITNIKRAAIQELMDLSMSNQGLDSFDALSSITGPVLFLHGDTETGSMVHPDDIESLSSLIRNLEIERIESAGHTIHRSHPDRWLRVVEAFIDAH